MCSKGIIEEDIVIFVLLKYQLTYARDPEDGSRIRVNFARPFGVATTYLAGERVV